MIEYAGPAYVLTLVHGTVPPVLGRWLPSDPSFTSGSSGLVERFRSLLNAPVVGVPFVWSGENSHEVRRCAGVALADHLRAVLESYPRAKHFLVAHSHGGNVCLYALRDPDLQRRVTGLVFLATPFIHVRRREVADTLTVLPLLLLAIPLILGAFVGLSVIGLSFGMLIELFWPDAPQIVGFVASVAALLMVGYALVRVYRLISRWMDRAVVTWIDRVQDATIDRLACPSCDEVPLLAVRTRRDEAGGWLRAYAALANMPFVLWNPRVIVTGAVILVVLDLFLKFFVYIETAHDSVYDNSDPARILGSLIGIVVAPILLSSIIFAIAQGWMLIAPKIFRAHRLVFGGETFLDNLFTRITALPLPDQKRFDAPPPFRVPVLTRQWPFVRLRHIAIHSNEDVLAFCAQWMAACPSTASTNPR